MDITGIILCGGKSSRMGGDKAMIDFQGKRMVEHVLENIKPICKEILISANDEKFDEFGHPVVPDQWLDFGPAAGIQSSLEKSGTELNLIISCDLPLASTEMLQYLYQFSEFAEITVPRVDTHLQPLCGYYKTGIRNRFRQYLLSGEKSPQFLIQNFNLRIITSEMMPGFNMQLELKNFNEPRDIQYFIENNKE